MSDIDEVIENAKKEKNRIGHMLYELQSKWGEENRKLSDMRWHRHQLKQLKQLLKNQHKSVTE